MTADGAPDSTLREDESLFPVFFYQERRRVLATVLDAELDVGRQREGEPEPALRIDGGAAARIILAPLADVEVSRSHIGLLRIPGGQVQVTNLSTSQPVRISPHGALAPGETHSLTPPFLLQIGQYAVRVDPPDEDDADVQIEGLPERTVPPGRRFAPEATLARMGSGTFTESALLAWLESVLGVFQSAANSHDFAQQAARAVVKIVGLDAAAMLCRSATGRWHVEALHAADAEAAGDTSSWSPSYTLLDRVASDRRTFRQAPNFAGAAPKSLQNVTALVAAPILDRGGDVIGALYGDRRTGSGSQLGASPQISEFEAKLVELMANGVAAGLARVKEEQAAAAARVQFEQFFTPQLAAQLQRDPELLEGRDAEVTVLFADIRGFSRVSERLGPERTMEWIHDTMSALSECVLRHDGVLVDFIGDELMAMWGAPLAQSEHPRLACLAARDMLAELPAINARWQKTVGGSIRLGIGLNSGIARVGNTGSRQKFKYGPLGDVVNVASRVQGATKYLGAECLITGTTLAGLPAGVAVRRLARVRVVNIEQPIDLYEIVAQAPPDWERRCTRYNEALEALEREDLDGAVERADKLVKRYPHDAAIEALARRARDARATHVEDSSGDTSVWRLPGK